MFRPRHAYKSPVTNRYRGKAKGCPVFNNIIEIDSHMVEQHDECLECLAKLKNRTELYRTLADNNKPSNNVIKSLQRLSSSASNNRLKTCLQFHIIKVNEKSISTQQPASGATQAPSTTLINGACVATSPKYSVTTNKDVLTAMVQPESQLVGNSTVIPPLPPPPSTRHLTKRQKSYLNRSRQLEQKQQLQKQRQQQHDQLASPPQDQVSSTQDGQIGPTKDDHDCQTSPPMLTTTHIDEQLTVSGDNKSSDEDDASPKTTKIDEHKNDDYICAQTTQSSPHINNNNNSNALTTSATTNTTTTTTTTTSTNNNNINNNNINTSPMRILDLHESPRNIATIDSDTKLATTHRWDNSSKNQPLNNKPNSISTSTTTNTDLRLSPVTKRRRTQNSLSSDQETSSVASWSLASYAATSPPSPISSASSTSSIDSASDSSSSSYCSSSSCLSSPRNSPSPSPLSSPDFVNELKGPRLRLNEQKIRKIKKKPVLFDDLYYYSDQPSITSTPTTSSGCSPGQHSNATQNSEQSSSCLSLGSIATYTVNHMFQAPPTFVNNLKPCSLPAKSQEASQASAPQTTTKVEMINCAICGIKDKPPNISKIYGQKSCALCMKFFAAFLQNPQQLYCAHDGDCLMTFDSRCQACWIKICLQKFNIDEEHRKIGHKYSPKLLSSPNVSLITIDTSLTQ